MVEALLQELPQRRLEGLRLVPRHAVPLLRLAPVVIVHRVHVVVLVVPTEGAEHHAEVQPRHVHAVDVRLNVPQHAAVGARHVVRVPVGLRVVLVLAEVRPGLRRRRLPRARKAAPEFLRVEVIAVLHRHFFRARLHDAPVVLLQGGVAEGPALPSICRVRAVVLRLPGITKLPGLPLVLHRAPGLVVEARALLQPMDVLDARAEGALRRQVDAAGRRPSGRRNDLADAVALRLRPDALDVRKAPHAPLLNARPEHCRFRHGHLRDALCFHHRVRERLLQHALLLVVHNFEPARLHAAPLRPHDRLRDLITSRRT